ncbi:MAG: hypothetical protein WCS85_05985 [Candidatus Peribacteraceae bacterium]
MVKRLFALVAYVTHIGFVGLFVYCGVFCIAVPTIHFVTHSLSGTDWQQLPSYVSSGCVALKFAHTQWRAAERILSMRWDTP